MILVDHEIKKMVENDNLIENFKENHLQSASYDITLNGKINRFKNEFRRVNPSKQSELDNIYEEIDITYGYDLRPNEFIMLQLKEVLNMPNNLIAHVRPRTSFIRLGLVISTQHINPTFRGKLHIGILNVSPYVIELRPGMMLCQLLFEQISTIPTEENLYKNKSDAKYQNENKFSGSLAYLELIKEYGLEDE